MNISLNPLLPVSTLALMMALAAPANAQSEQSAPEAAGAPPVSDIIVTAQKRSQSINDVGLTVKAFTAQDLERQKISTLADVAQAVPGLTFAATATNTPVFTLRGVGFYESTLAAYPTVSVYLDEVPLQFPAMTKLTAFDLERIEVLKGPQGTLFGQNSTGGAINYIAAKPTDTFSAGGDLSYGRFNTIEANAYISGPLAPTLSARLAGRVVHGDDWQRSYTRDDRLGEAEFYAGRFLLDWDPSSAIRFRLNVNGWKDKSDPLAAQYILANPQQPCCANPAVLAYPIAPDDTRAADWSPNSRPAANNRFWQVALRGEFDITDDLTLTSISSYAKYKTDQVPEGDGQSFNNFDFRDQHGFIKTFTQEVRISNNPNQKFRWVLGGNYEKSHVFEEYLADFSDSSTFPAFGIFASGLYTDQHLRNSAVFGNAELDIGKAFTLKAGARYTDARRRAENCTFDQDGGASYGFFEFLASAVYNIDVDLQPGDCYHFMPEPDVTPGPVYAQKLNEDNLSWRVGIDYKPTSDVLFYANVAKGYKAGSIPVTGAAVYKQYVGVKQESVLSYEAGVKAQLLDRTLAANAAVYYYDYRNKQLRSKAIDPVFGLIETLVNVDRSSVFGAELELTARPVRGLAITLAGTYTDAKVKEFVGVSSGGQSADFAGASVPYTPKYQASLIADYEWDAGNLTPFIGGDVRIRSDTTSIIGGDTVFIDGRQVYNVEGHALVNLRAGVRASDDRWRVMVWGKNVFDTYYWDNVFAQSDVVVRYAGRPATYGVTVGFKY